MPLLHGLPSGGGGTNVKSVGNRQPGSSKLYVYFQPGGRGGACRYSAASRRAAGETNVESVGSRQLG